jgi:hypothetical protein
MGSGNFPKVLATIRVGFGILGLVRGFTITSPAISAVRRRRSARARYAAHQRNTSRILGHLPRSHIASSLPQIARCGRRELAGHLITGAQTMTISPVAESSMKRVFAALAGVALGVRIAASATAHIGVGKSITLMAPYPAGGVSDAIAHLLTPAFAT